MATKYKTSTGQIVSSEDPNINDFIASGATKVVEPTVTPEPTIGETFSGVVGESAEEKEAREAVKAGYKSKADIVIDEDAIRRSTTEKFQSEIDALNKVFAEKKRVEGIAGEGRLGETGAIQARRGLLGSDFGATQTAGTREANLARQEAIETQKASELSNIYSQIRDKTESEVSAREKAKSLGSTNYLAFLRETKTRKKGYITDTVKNIITRQIEPTENDFNSIAEQLGVSVDDVKADYKTQFDAQEVARQTAEALRGKEALGARKTEAEIAKTQAEAGFKERQTTQFDIDDMRATDKVRADFEQQAFDNDITLNELQLDRDKYETDVDFKNAQLDLDTAKTQASIDKIYNDIDQTGAVSPLQQAQLDKLNAEVTAKKATADKAKIQAGNTADTLQLKIDGIDKLLGADSGLNKVVGSGAFGRNPLLDKLSGGLLSDSKARAFSSSIRQLISQETLDTLTELKKSGATLGAISEKELAILQGAATRINDWEVLDDEGKPTGKWNIDEATFKEELTAIKSSAERLRDAAKVDAEAGEGMGNRTQFDNIDQFLQESSTIQQESADKLKAEFPDLEDQDLIDLINEQSNFNKVESDTNKALPKEVSNANTGDTGGQCGRFVNKATGLGVGDTFSSKMAKMDKTIKKPEAGMVFTMPYKNTGHCGFIVDIEGDNAIVKDSNWSLDEKVKTHKVALNKMTGYARV